MIKFIKNNSYFYIPYLLFFIVSTVLLSSYSKKDIHLFINNLNCQFGDYFFKYFTHLGDGIIIAVLILVLLFIKYRYSIILVFSILSSTIVVQAFKRYILPDIVRPIVYFHNESPLHIVEGVDVHTAHSFPSGHTATAFTIFLLLAIISNKNYLKLMFFATAFLVGYSRIYLSQHFLSDVYAGSIIAVVLTTIYGYWIGNWKNPNLDLSITNRACKTNSNSQLPTSNF